MIVSQIVILFILLLLAAGVTWFFYSPRKEKWLFALRTFSLFFVLLFLWDPVFYVRHKQEIKPVLYVLTDRTVSVKDYDSLLSRVRADLTGDKDLASRFEVREFYFDSILHRQAGDYAGVTDIAAALRRLREEKTKENAAVVLLTDGRSTRGRDYRFVIGPADRLRVFPVTIGDTSRYPNVKIDRVDYNQRVGLDNEFIIQPYVAYENPREPVKTKILVRQGKRILFEQSLELDKNHAYRKLRIRLKAKSPGWQMFTVEILPFKTEKKKEDNRKRLSVNVVEQSARILILTGKIHPDAGVIRRVLSRIKTYKITLDSLIDPKEKFDLIIAVQPGRKQSEILAKRKEAVWYITGPFTDWVALNRWNGLFTKQVSFSGLTEQYLPVFNPGFDLFKLPEFNAEQYPALKDLYGEVQLKYPANVLFYAQIKNVKTNQPLTVYLPDRYTAATFGSGLWRWYLWEKKSGKTEIFTEKLIEKTVMYLLRKPQRDLLILKYKNRYSSVEPVKIQMQAYNTLWEENRKAKLYLRWTDSTGKSHQAKIYYNSPYFEAKLPVLKPGKYTFTVQYADYRIVKKGMFTVLPPAQEKPEGVAMDKLNELARYTGGKLYSAGQMEALKTYLKQAPEFKTKIRLVKEKKHLTDRYVWLLLAVFLLSAEWFYRKYRGI